MEAPERYNWPERGKKKAADFLEYPGFPWRNRVALNDITIILPNDHTHSFRETRKSNQILAHLSVTSPPTMSARTRLPHHKS